MIMHMYGYIWMKVGDGVRGRVYLDWQKLFVLACQGHPTIISGKYLLLKQLIHGWLTKPNKFKIPAGKINLKQFMNLASWRLKLYI